MYDNFTYIKTASAIPRAAAMIETFRAIGYSLETAVADIVDNSISALAKNVWINRIWKGGESVITIKDDGHGMSGEEIIQAMPRGAESSGRTIGDGSGTFWSRSENRILLSMSDTDRYE